MTFPVLLCRPCDRITERGTRCEVSAMQFLERIWFPLLEHELNWLYVLVSLVVSLLIGIIVTNFLYRGVSWYHLTKDDNWWDYFMWITRVPGPEKYLYIVLFFSGVVCVAINLCVIMLLEMLAMWNN